MRQNLRLTKINTAYPCEKRKSGNEALMKQTIEDIRNLLKESSFKDEQHVRFSLVGRICDCLGWDVWNPAEFYTEYPVKKYPPQEITVELRGRVDVALIITEKLSEFADVFIEVKTPHKLQTELQSGEKQLQSYNYWDKSAISILTDGITWRFYLPSAGGSFEDKLFHELNLINDDLDDVCYIFQRILQRENFNQVAIQSAEALLEEKRIALLIAKVKGEAERLAADLGDSKFLVAQKLIKNKHRKECQLSDIERLWDKTTTRFRPQPKPTEPDEPINDFGKDTQTQKLTDYRFTKPRFVKIAGKDPVEIHNWKQLKRVVYDFIVRSNRSLNLTGVFGFCADVKQYREPIALHNGFYTEGHLSATNIVSHCRSAMRAIGYNPDIDLVIGYTFTDKRKI